jgi:hypothetical protein
MTTEFVNHRGGRCINTVRDGFGPMFNYMSVVPREGNTSIHLVFGASFMDRCASALTKQGLEELIDILKDIHSVMEYEQED